MSTPDPTVELVAKAIYLDDFRDATADEWAEDVVAGEYRQNARAVLAALDLDARDARVRAEALDEAVKHAQKMADNLEDWRALPPDHASRPMLRAKWGSWSYEARWLRYLAASPSSSPVDAPSRPDNEEKR